MNKITCVGYHATGAGVIDDLLRECDNVVQGTYEAECRFLHDADGIRDLEYNLIENHHRLNSGHALKRYLRYVDINNRQCSKVFGDKWKSLSREYVYSLIKFEYRGYNYTHRTLFTLGQQWYWFFRKGINKLKPKRFRESPWHNYFPRLTTFHSKPSEEEFLLKTRKYVDCLAMSVKDAEKAEYVVIDQLVPGTNPERYLRYVNDLKVIVVDRDPRDVYIHQALIRERTLPKDPHEFCVYYRDIRPQMPVNDPPNVLRVSFEDLVLNYEKTVAKVFLFLEIESHHHVAPFMHFDPKRSIRGIRQWERYPEYREACKVIEQELPEFLYKS